MEDQKESNVPDILSPEWHEYAMSFFTPQELFDGYPLTTGLRRVSELLIGEIVSSKPTMVSHLQSNDPTGRTTVVYEVVFLVKRDGKEYTKLYADTAEAWAGNTDDAFLVHSAATASTRAEGRALRKALKLRTVAAEELCEKDVKKFLESVQTPPANSDDDFINSDQINYIDAKCRKLDIDVMAFVNSGETIYPNIKMFSRSYAAELIKKLNSFSNDMSLISSNIKGYNGDWKK